MKKNIRIILATMLFTGLILMSTNAFAVDPYFSSNGKAIRGYDPVAYFTENKPVKGLNKFSFKWKDTTWYFSSKNNLDLFRQNPQAYAPQFGGYCAWAVSKNYTASTSPNAWSIVNNKLYLNYSTGVRSTWNKQKLRNIEKANKNWPGIIGG